jgi:hypothetical protein
MTLLVTVAAMAALLIPGLAAVHVFARGCNPEAKLAIAPAVSIVVYAIGGIFGWVFPAYFIWISWGCVAGTTGVGVVVLALTRGLRIVRAVDPVLPVAYGVLVLFSTQLSLLPTQGPAIAAGGTTTGPGQLMSLVGVHGINMSGHALPQSLRLGAVAHLEGAPAYYPFFLAAACLNALCILPIYLIASRLAGRTVARLSVLLLACNYGMILHTAVISPEALAGYFVSLLTYGVLSGSISSSVMGLLLALSGYAYPWAAAVGLGFCAFPLLTSGNRPKAFSQLAFAGAVGLGLVVPWYAWSWVSRQAPLLAGATMETQLVPSKYWLFLPVAVGLGSGLLTARRRWVFEAVNLACQIAQAVPIWLVAFLPNQTGFQAGDWHVPTRLFGLIGLQLMVAVMSLSICVRRYRGACRRTRRNRRVIYPAFKPQPFRPEPVEISGEASVPAF